MAAFGVPKKNNQEGDTAVLGPPTDSVSSIALNGNLQMPSNAILATSWDCTVTCYAMQQQGHGQFGGGGVALTANQAGQIRHDAPALCCDFASDNMTALSGGCDGSLRQWNINNGPQSMSIVGRHDNSIRCLKWTASHNVVVTAGWDKQIKVWDLRSPQPAMQLMVSERVYAMDVNKDAIVLGTADRNISVIDLRSRSKYCEFKSPMAYQTRCISIFNDDQGFAVGCIEGRVGIEYFSELQNKNRTTPKLPTQNFVFKCHRDKNDIYAVNAIHFHPQNTFVTAGSDGVLSTWDKDNRSRLANFDHYNKRIPVTDAKFSPNGQLMVYSLSYDWSKGADMAAQYNGQSRIFIHPLAPQEYQKKK